MFNLKKKIIIKSTFNTKTINGSFHISISCLGHKAEVVCPTGSLNYLNIDSYNININEELRNLLVNELLKSDEFIKLFKQIENREKNLKILLK